MIRKKRKDIICEIVEIFNICYFNDKIFFQIKLRDEV